MMSGFCGNGCSIRQLEEGKKGHGGYEVLFFFFLDAFVSFSLNSHP